MLDSDLWFLIIILRKSTFVLCYDFLQQLHSYIIRWVNVSVAIYRCGMASAKQLISVYTDYYQSKKLG